MKIMKPDYRYKLALAVFASSILSGCMQYRYMDSSPVAQHQSALQCETSNGVLGVNAGSVLTQPAARYTFEKLMTESGCYSAVRFRRTISQVGHHVVLRDKLPPRPETYPADLLSFIPFFLTASIFPVQMTVDLDYSVTYYTDGDSAGYADWENQHREYLSLFKVPVPGASTLADFESQRARDVATTVLTLLESKQ